MALEINSQNFETLIADGKPVVVDFWATWCGPCQMVGPFIEQLAQEYEGRVTIGKCDVDKDEELPSRFSVRAARASRSSVRKRSRGSGVTSRSLLRSGLSAQDSR